MHQRVKPDTQPSRDGGADMPGLIFLDDTERRRELRSKRRAALALLLAMGALFLLTFLATEPGFWILLTRQSIEAGLAGGLADWFAVTALFRRPLGLPIPHTGIVEQEKDHVARSVGGFVERNFLSPTLIAARVQGIDPAKRIAVWLTSDANAQRLAERLVEGLPTIVTAVEDQGLREFVARTLGDELRHIEFAPVLGRTLEVLSRSGETDLLFERMLDGLLDLVFDNAGRIEDAIEKRQAWWAPRSMDRRITNAILTGIEDFVEELRAPDSANRVALRGAVERMVSNLLQSQDQRAQMEALKHRLIADPDIQAWLKSIWGQVRSTILVDPARSGDGSTAGVSVRLFLQSCGRALVSDRRLQHHINEIVTAAVQNTAMLLRGGIGAYIADVVRGWDARTIADRMELAIGANLQFIRINGTLVGALAGCGLFLLSRVLG